MHIVNSCANDIQLTENNKQCQKCKLSLEQILVSFCSVFSDNFCRENYLMTSLLMWCSSHLHGKQFPITHNKTTYFHMHISISEFVIPLCCRYQVVQSCTCKKYSKDMQFLATAPYYNPTTYSSCESLKEHTIFNCIISHNHKEDIYKSNS